MTVRVTSVPGGDSFAPRNMATARSLERTRSAPSGDRGDPGVRRHQEAHRDLVLHAAPACLFGMATCLSTDVLFGSGLRPSVVAPDDMSLPNYAAVPASVAQHIPIGLGQGTQLRFDAINLFGIHGKKEGAAVAE